MVEFGMNDGMVRVVFNPQLKSRIPASAMAQVMRAQQEIQSGALRVGVATGG
jgi:basic membrane lipoprotein Med (substrate-binding protein (PBP1-ABC) superfamily)